MGQRMRCPYCRRDVDHEATVCGYCQRDLGLYSSIAERCARTERGLTALRKHSGEVDIGPATAIVASIVLAFLFDYISWMPFANSWIELPFQALGVIAPVFAAIMLGRFSSRTSTTGCFAIGMTAGFGGFVAHVFVWAFAALQSYTDCVSPDGGSGQNCAMPGLLPAHWYLSAITYPAAGALLFISGHAFGRRLRSPLQKWRAGDEVGSAEQDQNLGGRNLEALIGVLTAVLPKVIEFLVTNNATSVVSGGSLH